MSSDAAVHEPNPVVNTNPPCYLNFKEIFKSYPDIQADIDARAQEGHKKYGTYLQPFNGRNVKMDIYQELLDAGQYMEQLLEEMELGSFDPGYKDAYGAYCVMQAEINDLIRQFKNNAPEISLVSPKQKTHG